MELRLSIALQLRAAAQFYRRDDAHPDLGGPFAEPDFLVLWLVSWAVALCQRHRFAPHFSGGADLGRIDTPDTVDVPRERDRAALGAGNQPAVIATGDGRQPFYLSTLERTRLI